MTVSTELIILNSTKVGEKSLIVHCLSPAYGRRSFITSLSYGSALFMPLSIISAEIVSNPKSDLYRLKSPAAVFPLNGIRTSGAKTAISLFISEVLYRSILSGTYEEGLFEWCKRTVLTLDALKDNYSNFHLRFLFELASALGFSPSAESLAPFAGEFFSDLSALCKCGLDEFLLFPLSGSRRSAIADCLIRYLSYHLDFQLNIKSLAVLQELN